MRKVIDFFVLIISICYPWILEAQIDLPGHQDTLILDNKYYNLETSPLGVYRDNSVISSGLHEYQTGFGIAKAYICTFQIEQDTLFLLKVNAAYSEIDNTPSVDSMLRHRIELITNRKFNKNGRLQADWFSGTIRARHKGVVNYVPIGGITGYEPGSGELYEFTFNNGLLTKKLKKDKQNNLERAQHWKDLKIRNTNRNASDFIAFRESANKTQLPIIFSSKDKKSFWAIDGSKRIIPSNEVERYIFQKNAPTNECKIEKFNYFHGSFTKINNDYYLGLFLVENADEAPLKFSIMLVTYSFTGKIIDSEYLFKYGIAADYNVIIENKENKLQVSVLIEENNVKNNNYKRSKNLFLISNSGMINTNQN